MASIRAFNEISSIDFENEKIDLITKKIESEDKNYLIGVNEEEYISFLINEFSVEPLVIHFDQELIEEPKVKKRWVDNFRAYDEKYQVDSYIFKIKIPYEGSPELLSVRPSTYVMSFGDIGTEMFEKTIIIKMEVTDIDSKAFIKEKESLIRRTFANLNNSIVYAERFNNKIKLTTPTLFTKRKEKILRENKFFQAINVKIDDKTKKVFSPPTVKKTNIPQPKLSGKSDFSLEPKLSVAIPVPKWFGRTQKPHLLNENSTLVACATPTCMT
ncbi:hypothetical protein [Lewinella cohaerens]|uniref:hypothetical protein n=1 Tax=Lewinella cohaerens TaxID=70995 RepID=UPI000365B833|nr:hypothetical protein [Lewinella cohaerens]